ncbi:hypothetical protein VC83_03238 [Pseudogymnoascus destructans]|uniref:Alcohol dehydrogenase-like C-terminal domain-containing protein n=2 Tax=Pseudogymnoascus destructans TaxID=655981 RepID=L8G0U3_PSED2|nr:uncharacterized protein VC83_03238 [Pseudogymnoascus destructans]ELR06338.1 hypothetical protein GMDG_07929 [Pseudogymnoascus destructans 20631-21]OAF60654.1 hypothetical protein VC83_03238 [Pseudogymnoascus destructans]
MSFVDATSIPLVGLTVLQVLRRAEAELGGLKGKTAYVPGGLSGTGNVAIQLLLNVFGVKEVITTLSTGKMERAKELFKGGWGEVVYLDYTKENVSSAIGAGTVDFMLDTMAAAIGASLYRSAKRRQGMNLREGLHLRRGLWWSAEPHGSGEQVESREVWCQL